MPREYRHIKQYEREIMELREQGLIQRQIGERFGISYKKMKDFFRRHNHNHRKLSLGEAPKRRDRPRKDGTVLPPSIQQLSVLAQTRYELEQVKRHNKQLQMEFVDQTQRKYKFRIKVKLEK